MDKKNFRLFCKREFESRGFRNIKSAFFLAGQDLLCEMTLQKSDYGDFYYINYFYFIGNYKDQVEYPTRYSSDIEGRIEVMSKTQTYQGKPFMTAQVEYEKYTEYELKSYFDKEFEEKILPPIFQGKRYILENLDKLYFLSLNQENVIKRLQA